MSLGASQYSKYRKLSLLEVSGGWFGCHPDLSAFLWQQDWEREIVQEGFDGSEEDPKSSVIA